MTDIYKWVGISGNSYLYEVHPMDFIYRSSQPGKLVSDTEMSWGLGTAGRSPFDLYGALVSRKGLVDLFKGTPGTYIFAKMEDDEWKPIYIGETADLHDRIRYHEEMNCVESHGATHIHIHSHAPSYFSLSEAVRLGTSPRKSEESDLLGKHKTPCNEQYP